jgi:hypothetical protein
MDWQKLWIKVGLNGVFTVPLLMWFTEAGFWGAAVTSVLLSVIAFFVGDQLILKASNNTAATLADAVLAFFYLYLVADYMNWSLGMGELLTIVAVLGMIEAVYHRMLGNMDKATE